MNTCRLKASNISKHYTRTWLFKNISFEVKQGEILAITGWNGSGKSTLLRIIAGLTLPNSGNINLFINEKLQPNEKRRLNLGLLSSALSLYDDLTALENLNFFLKVRGINGNKYNLQSLITRVGLKGWENELYSIFSSGMKQRLKLAQAIIHNPLILLLDEPFSNLDTRGIDIFDNVIHEQKSKGIVILASNEKREIEYADTIINLSE